MTFDLTTFLFELVDFLVLVVVLWRFVLKPLSAGIATRRAALRASMDDTAARFAEAERFKAELEGRSKALDELRDQIMGEATAEAASERARILAQAREDAASERSRVQTLLDAEREAALAWVRDEAVERGTEVAGKLLLSLAPAAAHGALVDRLVAEIHARPAPFRGAAHVELTLPGLDDAGGVERIRAALAEVAGKPVELVLREDRAIGAGAVLRVGDHRFDASVAGQLEILRDEARRHLDEREA
ncbi:MAG: F0F1 ATP synthase subunit delta [Alphaproteobacteria bacterium]|nr:F0F1 ATP synthase subunit delta [Alphaproteobacteria bacterium]